MHALVAVGGKETDGSTLFYAQNMGCHLIWTAGNRRGIPAPALSPLLICSLTFLCFATLNRTTAPSTLAAAAKETDGFSLSASRAVERMGSEFSERVVIPALQKNKNALCRRW